MTDSLTFVVDAKPVSTNATYRRGKGSGFYKTSEAVAFQNAVKLTARKAMAVAGLEPLTGYVQVGIHFTFESALADVDGPIKGILDSMEGIVYPNDRKVTRLLVSKSVGPKASVAIKVQEIETASEVEAEFRKAVTK